MAWQKYLILIFSSLWFFPVSCTTATIIGIKRLEQRTHIIQPGEVIHPTKFSIAVFPGDAGQTFKRIPYSQIDSYPASAFHAPAASATQGGENNESYKVQAQGPTFQTIEVMKQGDTQTLWSTYQRSASGITPISSREFNMGAVIVLPIAAVIASLIYGLGRFLRRRFEEGDD